MATQLTKSDYLMYLKHPAWLWLKKHKPKLLPPIDANTQARFDDGNLFESIVEQKFAGLTRLGFDSYDEYKNLTERTRKLLSAGDKLISQARFEAGPLTCICDIVEQTGEHTLELYEIKASTKVKPEHIDDLAFQTNVLVAAGYKVSKISVIFCNNRYVRSGKIDPNKIGVTQDVTAQVAARLEQTKAEIKKALAVVAQADMPDPSPARARLGCYKEWLEIYLKLKPPAEPYNIYKLCRGNERVIAELEHRGISRLVDVPDDLELKPAQVWQVDATKRGEPIIDEVKIDKFLAGLEYPLYFLDYETLGSVVPPFDGLRPYQQLPFQYSLHILDSPDSELRHTEYLHTTNNNPCQPLLKQLQADIGERGTVLTWNEGFEKKCNELLGQQCPDFADFTNRLNAQIQDLMLPFAKGYYIDADFYGSASIKNVLPVLVPELNHKDMEISEGATAQRLWMQTVLGDAAEGRDKLFKDLLAYCELDTLAMVKIYEFLHHLQKPSPIEPVQPTLF
jgi:hypothetical protein